MSTIYKDEGQFVRELIEGTASKIDFERPELSLKTEALLSAHPATTQVICVASGKGGTGKTMISTNISVALAAKGLSVALIDADFGLANSHILLGLEPRFDISSVLSGKKHVADVIEHGPFGVKLVPGGSGFSELAMLDDEKFRYLVRELSCLEGKTDIVVIDLAAGITPQIMRLLSAAHEIVVVTTPEVTSLIDAYALIKSLTQIVEQVTVKMIINRAPDQSRAMVAFQKIWSVVNKHLLGKVSLMFLGWLPQNFYVQNSIVSRKPVILKHPKSVAARAIEGMAEKIHKNYRSWKGRQVDRWGAPSYFAKLECTTYVK
jgi:flagellar biosynthesis protein FlhG